MLINFVNICVEFISTSINNFLNVERWDRCGGKVRLAQGIFECIKGSLFAMFSSKGDVTV